MTSQIIINILISSSTFLLIALSFSLIYEVTRFFHFAHAVVFTSGAYFTYLFHILLGVPLFISITLAVAAACLIGCMMEVFVYKPLRKRDATSIILLLASLGIYIVLQNLISCFLMGTDA